LNKFLARKIKKKPWFRWLYFNPLYLNYAVAILHSEKQKS